MSTKGTSFYFQRKTPEEYPRTNSSIGTLAIGSCFSVRASSYGCTREVWRAREKRKSCSRRSREQLYLLESEKS